MQVQCCSVIFSPSTSINNVCSFLLLRCDRGILTATHPLSPDFKSDLRTVDLMDNDTCGFCQLGAPKKGKTMDPEWKELLEEIKRNNAVQEDLNKKWRQERGLPDPEPTELELALQRWITLSTTEWSTMSLDAYFKETLAFPSFNDHAIIMFVILLFNCSETAHGFLLVSCFDPVGWIYEMDCFLSEVVQDRRTRTNTSVAKTGRLLVSHEAPVTGGFAAEISSTVQMHSGYYISFSKKFIFIPRYTLKMDHGRGMTANQCLELLQSLPNNDSDVAETDNDQYGSEADWVCKDESSSSSDSEEFANECGKRVQEIPWEKKQSCGSPCKDANHFTCISPCI
ncbi:UNVERIFIED_CONTAM: hypothetical protein FKN15_061046 [Acipenser sinensis]